MDDTESHFNIRCPKDLREKAEASAVAAGQSLAEWIRRAMREKLEREKKVAVPRAELSTEQDADVEDMVRALIEKVLAEKGL